jgi:hypothetical protein
VPERQLVSDSPYFLLFSHLILNLCGITSVFAPDEICKFVFDEQVGYDTDIMLWWPQFKHIAETASNTNFTKFIGGPPSFYLAQSFVGSD